MIPYLGLASGLGGADSRCAEGPLVLSKLLTLGTGQIFIPESKILDKYDHLALLNQRLADAAYRLASEHPFFLSLGGDHSSAIGTWSGVARAQKGEIGLLWIDAHMDAHTPETSESGNIHGMPVAALLGYGDPRFTRLSPRLNPRNVALIGIRSFESAEEALLKRLGVRIYYMQEVKERGFQAVLKEAEELVSLHTTGYGISFDLDGIDPTFVPAVGTPVPDGLDPKELLGGLSQLKKRPLALEIVEYIPSLDPQRQALSLIQKMVHLFEKKR
jgi:arginase